LFRRHACTPPWSAEVTPNCFIGRDANGQALSYIYSEPGRRSGGQAAQQRRGAADCQQHRQAAEAVALKATAAMGNDTKGGCNMPKLRLAARRSQLALARHQKRLQQECPRQFQFG
jgi:hypothetical protein